MNGMYVLGHFLFTLFTLSKSPRLSDKRRPQPAPSVIRPAARNKKSRTPSHLLNRSIVVKRDRKMPRTIQFNHFTLISLEPSTNHRHHRPVPSA
jgi:hypothetical protein